MKLSSRQIIELAYDKGYRATDDGNIVGPSGKILKIRIKPSQFYPQFTVNHFGRTYSSYMHRFAAYCFYGESLFDDGIEVRHLNHDRLDFSKKNIALGTSKENKLDRSYEDRLRIAKIGAQHVKKFTDEQIKEIRFLLDKGETLDCVAKKYNAGSSTIDSIKRWRTYKDVK